MGETTAEIESEIDDTREALKSNLEELETRVKEVTHWRSLARKHPGPMLGAALLGGMVLAALIKR